VKGFFFLCYIYRLIGMIDLTFRQYEMQCLSSEFSIFKNLILPVLTNRMICALYLLDINDGKKRKWELCSCRFLLLYFLFSFSRCLSLSLYIRDQFVIPTCNDKRQLEIEPNMIWSRRNSLFFSVSYYHWWNEGAFPICVV
jgi:hypothetical protein